MLTYNLIRKPGSSANCKPGSKTSEFLGWNTSSLFNFTIAMQTRTVRVCRMYQSGVRND